MLGFFSARGYPRTLLLLSIVAVLFTVTQRVFHIAHPQNHIAFPLSLPLLFLLVFAVTLSLHSSLTEFEAVGARDLRLYKLANVVILTALSVAVLLLSKLIGAQLHEIHEITVGEYAPIRGFLGLFGLTMLASCYFNARLAGLFAIPGSVLGAVFDTNAWPIGWLPGFVYSNADNVLAWVWACLLWFAGVVFTVFWGGSGHHR